MKAEGTKTKIATPDLDRTIRRMDNQIEAFAERRDRRERFLVMYRTFKNELRRNLQQGRFLDSEWSEAICCRMGEMYFEANTAYQYNKEECPASWRICFDAAIKRETNLLQDALMGMNAHINYDLTICVYDVMLKNGDFQSFQSGRTTTQFVDRKLNSLLKKRYFDYLLINQIAWESIPLIQEVLTERFAKFLGFLNHASFQFSRAIVEKLILDYRDRAWTHALLLLSSKDADEHQQIRDFMDDLAVSNTQLIRNFVSYNPLNLIRPALNPETVENATDKSLQPLSADLLRSKLQQRETAEYAARTFVEYGAAAVPYLQKMLEETEDRELIKQIYRIFGKINTDESAELLSRQLPSEAPPPYPYFKAIFDHDSHHVQKHFSVETFHEIIGTQLFEYVNSLQISHDLAEVPDIDLIKWTLADRQKQSKQLLRIILKILLLLSGIPRNETNLREDDAYYTIVSEALGTSWTDLLQLILQGKQNDKIQESAANIFQPNSMDPDERFRDILKSDDEWLKLCVHQYLRSHETDFDIQITSEQLEGTTMISTVEKVLYLKNVELFNEIPAEELTSIAKVAHVRAFQEDEFLIRQGDPGKNLYIITSGIVNVLKEGSSVTKLEEGDVLGEMSLLMESTASADCVAETDVQTLELNQEDFLGFLYEGYPEIALGLIKVLAQRLEQTTSQLDTNRG